MGIQKVLAVIFVANFFDVIAVAQLNTTSNSILDAYSKGVALRLEREWFELEKRSQSEQLNLTRAETERLKAETERIRAETARLENQKKSTPAREAEFKLEIDKSIALLVAKYPDSKAYFPGMSTLSLALKVDDSSTLTLSNYLESLYLIAKHASFFNDSTKATSPTQQ